MSPSTDRQYHQYPHPQTYILTPPITVLRNPVYFIFLILLGAGAYITYTLNLWGPMYQMANAASAQALEEGKKRLREFLEASEGGRQAMAYSGQDDIKMRKLNGNGKVVGEEEGEDDDI